MCQTSNDPTAATGAQSATKQENQKLRISYLPYNVHPKRADRLPPEQMHYRTLKINKKGAHLPARPFSYLNTNVPTAPNILFDNSDRLHYVRQTNHRSVWTCAQFDRVQYVQAISDCTHNGILTVQEITWFKHDEKLAVRAV